MVSKDGHLLLHLSAESSIHESATIAKSPVFACIATSFILSICFAIKEMGWLARRGKAITSTSRSDLRETV